MTRARWFEEHEPIPIGKNIRWAIENAALAAGVVDAACDNVTASTIGEACNAAGATYAGDTIDRGLALVRLLRERGFVVVKVPTE